MRNADPIPHLGLAKCSEKCGTIPQAKYPHSAPHPVVWPGKFGLRQTSWRAVCSSWAPDSTLKTAGSQGIGGARCADAVMQLGVAYPRCPIGPHNFCLTLSRNKVQHSASPTASTSRWWTTAAYLHAFGPCFGLPGDVKLDVPDAALTRELVRALGKKPVQQLSSCVTGEAALQRLKSP